MRGSTKLLFGLLSLSIGLAGCTMSPAELGLGQSIKPDKHPFLIPANATNAEKGQIHYKNGSYGLSEKAFRAAVEKEPSNAEAWLGLAASYDRLGRFDHAQRSYNRVIRLVGYTPTLLNNLGYHYYLQGNNQSALQTLERAHQGAPTNKHILNNLALVRESAELKRSTARESKG
ncbi:MAG: tetratricopeptide repeat protein [Pseudomonadota bacterium]